MINDHISFPNFVDAQCTTGDPDFFFPNSEKELQERLPTLEAICNGCRHKIDCAEFAIENAISDGFWGGFTPDALRSMINVQGKHFDKRHKRLQEALAMREMGWSDEVIAEAMGVTVEAISRQFSRAKEKGNIS